MPEDPNGLNSSLEELNEFVSSAEDEIEPRPYPKPSLATRRELERRLLVAESQDQMHHTKAGSLSWVADVYEHVIKDIPPGFESKFYRMNRKTVDLLFDGSMLKDGMIVLIEDSMSRVDLDGDFRAGNPYAVQRAEENNRWCRVSEVNFSGEGDHRLVSFVAEYADGTKIKRTRNTSYAWYVLYSSLFAGRETEKQ